MTIVTYETATLADALAKAALVAPSKGAALDKSAGIVLAIDPDSSQPTTMKATNLEIFYTEIIDTVKAEGEPVTWRLPSLIASIIKTLPIGSGKQVTLEQEGNRIRVKQGRATATIGLISTDYYPQWEPFDPSGLEAVSSLGERIKQVQWAASTSANTEPLNGIHFDGSRIICTDKYRIAIADCDTAHAIPDPVTVPAGILGSVIKQMGDTRVGSDGDMMLLMPDDHTQIKAVLFAAEYLKVDRIISREMPESLTVRKDAILDIVQRASAMIGSERAPTLRIFIGKEEIAALLNNEAMQGLMGDVVEIPGQATHARIELKFTPKMLTDALVAVPNDELTLMYSTDTSRPHPLVVDGGSGYKAWVQPRLAEKKE